MTAKQIGVIWIIVLIVLHLLTGGAMHQEGIAIPRAYFAVPAFSR